MIGTYFTSDDFGLRAVSGSHVRRRCPLAGRGYRETPAMNPALQQFDRICDHDHRRYHHPAHADGKIALDIINVALKLALPFLHVTLNLGGVI